ERLLDWAGPDESLIEPPKRLDGGDLGDAEHYVFGVEDDSIRPVQPDALLRVADAHGELVLFVEYDRTRRVDKNYDKFRRYEALLAGWWPRALPTETRRPAVVFICQDSEHRDRFLAAADWQLTAHQTGWADLNPQREYPVRDRFLFALERDIHEGRPAAVRLPRHPPDVENRNNRVRGVRLPGGPTER